MKTLKVTNIATILILISASLATSAFATNPGDPFGLGNAMSYGVLSLGGSINMSGGSLDGGNAGVYGFGQQLGMSGGSRVSGFADIYGTSAFNRSGGAKVVGGVNLGTRNSFLQGAYNSALSASASYASAPGLSIAVTDSNFTINESVVGNYVFKLANLQLSGSHTLMLNAPAGSTFVLDISGKFTLSGSSKVTEGAGMSAANVLLNVTGSGSTVDLSGGTAVNGTILATQRNVNVSGGSVVNGRVIAQNINLSGGVHVISAEY